MKLFGFEIKRPEEEQHVSFAPQVEDDGAVVVSAGGAYGTYVDLDGSVRTETELISKYRDMAGIPEVEMAIDDIVNDSITVDNDEPIIKIVLERTKLSSAIKKIITEEFDYVLELLEFTTLAYEIYKRWYVDGRLYYHAIIDETAPREGIKELRYIDPRKIRKVRETKKVRDKENKEIVLQKTVSEFYIYNERGFAQNTAIYSASTPVASGVKIAKDSIIYTTSGLLNNNGDMVLSYLHKAIKPLNQLRAMEDATVIYRISRAPERRIFYIDVGNLPKMKAEQYVRDLMTRFKNKLVYDVATGEIKDDRKFMTMLEDFWLPRREGGKGTEITTLPAGQNLGELQDVEYFQKKLFRSLNVPISRMDPESVYSVGRATEITRDEVKFAKFVDRLRRRFSMMFLKVLEKQLLLKGIITSEDWAEIENKIDFQYAKDNYFDEMKDNEVLMGRLNTLQLIEQYAGKYYSHEKIRKMVLRQTQDEIDEEDEKIAAETDNLQYNPPSELGTEMPDMQKQPFKKK
jgi:hypothetical protein